MGHSLLTACCPYECLPGQKVPRDDALKVRLAVILGDQLPVMLSLLLLKMSLRGAALAFQCAEQLNTWICDPSGSTQHLLPL